MSLTTFPHIRQSNVAVYTFSFRTRMQAVLASLHVPCFHSALPTKLGDDHLTPRAARSPHSSSPLSPMSHHLSAAALLLLPMFFYSFFTSTLPMTSPYTSSTFCASLMSLPVTPGLILLPFEGKGYGGRGV